MRTQCHGDIYQNTTTFNYAQVELRFTATISVSDFGIQYYFGRFPRLAISGLNPRGFVTFTPSPVFHPESLIPLIDYNYFHQIGVYWARVIVGFNVRAKTGVNITIDMEGDGGAVYNPQFVWSLGFDRDVMWGINLNLQGNGLVRLMCDKIGFDPLSDTAAGIKPESLGNTGKTSM